MMLHSRAYMKNTKLGSVQIYYSAYNKAAVLEKKLTIVLKSDATDHRYDFISHSRQYDGNCFQVALHKIKRPANMPKNLVIIHYLHRQYSDAVLVF